MIELWYKWRLGVWIAGFNHQIDPYLDNRLNECLNHGIDEFKIKTDKTKIIKFSNGTTLEFWDANKYYAWLLDGLIIYPNGQKYIWSYVRPKAKTMYRFKKALENYKPPIVIVENPFNL